MSESSGWVAGRLVEIRVDGHDLEREISNARAAGRVPSRAAEAFIEFARGQLT